MWPCARFEPLASVALVGVVMTGCALDTAPVPRPDPSLDRSSLQLGPSAHLDASLAPIACASRLACRSEGLVDPATARRGATLYTALECSLDADSATPERDAMLAMERKLTCYDAGDPADPSTWSPPGGHVIAAPVEETYAAITDPLGGGYLHTATLLGSGDGHAFCRYEAWATLRTAPLDSPRVATYRAGAAVGHWLSVLADDDGDGHLECPSGVGEARLGYALAAAYGPAAPLESETFPARYDSVIVLETETPATGYVLGAVHGLDIVSSRGMRFPIAIGSEVAAFERRSVDIVDPASGQPIDLELVTGCVETDEDGELVTVALLTEERWTHRPLGAVVLTPDPDAIFDCERNPASGHCAVVAREDFAQLAPCLVTPPPPVR